MVGAGGAVEVTGGVRALVRAAGVIAAAGVAALSTTCKYGEVTVVQPAAKGSGALVLSIQTDGEDAAVAQQLGWSAGIPGADVTIAPGDGDTAVGPPIATLVTDSAGKVSVADLPDGKYFVQVRRLLTSAELAQLAPGEDAVGFMTQTVLDRGSASLSVPASHRRSIVISEWSFVPLAIPNVGGYTYGGYLELANNSDTTVYLDGLVVGSGLLTWVDPRVPCEALEPVGNDPDGVWADRFDSLPGTGHTYPLAPGAVAVIATDAIDHSAITPEGLDLTQADFEGIGTADVDNPSVPNTVTIGPRAWFLDHGLLFWGGLVQVVFVALPVDTAALPKQVLFATAWPFDRVPRGKILDVVTLAANWGPFPGLCPWGLVNRNFDRRSAQILQFQVGKGQYSIQRLVAFTRPDGRKVLQDTRTSNVDLFVGPRTPFRLP